MAKRCACLSVTVLGLIATACFSVGFIAPWWVVMERSLVVEEFDIPKLMDTFMAQEQQFREIDERLLDEDDMTGELPERNRNIPEPDLGPMDPKDWENDRPRAEDWKEGDIDWEVRMPDGSEVPVQSDDEDGPRPQRDTHHHGHHHDRHHHRHHHHDCDSKLASWAANSFGMEEVINGFQLKRARLHGSFGLWYTVYCIKVHDLLASDKKDTCSCVKVNTECALKYAQVFGSCLSSFSGDINELSLSSEHIGGASLKEHRIEFSIGVALCVIGLLAGIVGFAKASGRCLKFVCVLALLTALSLLLVPSVRLSKYSHDLHRHHDDGVEVKLPYSALATHVGSVFAVVTMIAAMLGAVRKQGREAPGKWYAFNNELVADQESDVKKTGIVFLSEPLPEKPGMYDVIDDVKQAEGFEPEMNSVA